MSYKVFIISNVDDKPVINEIKEIFERYEIQVIMPQYRIIDGLMVLNKEQTSKSIRWSNCVLVIIRRMGSFSEDMESEIRQSILLNKLVIPIVEEGSEIPNFLSNRQYILMDRGQPRLSYERAAKYLKELKIDKEKKDALGGLLLLGLSILLLAALASGD